MCCMACLNYMYIHVVPTYIYLQDYIGIDFMMFNATFNNISIISRQSFLLVEQTTDLPQVPERDSSQHHQWW